MKHFLAQNWTDFVRGRAAPAEMREMQQHLDQKCPECLRNVDTWRLVMQHTRQSTRMEPPDSSLRAVKAGFALRKVVSFPSGKLDLATLQFDSDRQPLAAGMRSGQATARQLLYKSGSVCIDMRMEPTPGSESIVLMGQLLDSMHPGHGISGVPVSLLSKGDTLLQKETNAAGEFDFGLELHSDMQLVFGIRDSRTIVVSVPQANTKEKTKGKSSHRMM
jgi:anti-sigma factor RsiW